MRMMRMMGIMGLPGTHYLKSNRPKQRPNYKLRCRPRAEPNEGALGYAEAQQQKSKISFPLNYEL